MAATPHTFKLCFSAGESSGDKHAAAMFLELQKQYPALHAIGMGSHHMRQAGIDIRFDSSAIGVIGLIEILKHYTEIRSALNLMKQLLTTEKPDLLVCVDYKEFNLKLAQFAKKLGIKVLFYVSPQVWAWRPGRVVTYGKAIDMMAVIFPFETAYYDAKNIPVRYVGHPSVDKVRPLRSKADDINTFHLETACPIIGILPGSRSNEIKRMLPVMLKAAEILQTRYPDAKFLLPQADSVRDETLESYLKNTTLEIQVIKHQVYDVIQCCDVIMTVSGTATLEVALLQIPMVIAYRLSPISYFIAKQLVKIPYIGLPNIIAEKAIAKELIQAEANPENLVEEIQQLLNDQQKRTDCLQGLSLVKQRLGQGGGSKNMADLALEMLTGKKYVD